MLCNKFVLQAWRPRQKNWEWFSRNESILLKNIVTEFESGYAFYLGEKTKLGLDKEAWLKRINEHYKATIANEIKRAQKKAEKEALEVEKLQKQAERELRKLEREAKKLEKENKDKDNDEDNDEDNNEDNDEYNNEDYNENNH